MNRAARKALKRKAARKAVSRLDSNGYERVNDGTTVFYGTTAQILAKYGTAQQTTYKETKHD
ncbi:hypothetical protein AN944_02305 [Shewanella sp. P1-14-1]|uniref:hypothetical protein n=1 Tax=Shewanella sp. P1-14-1 TaxID=1723761 RepID=UPI0006D65486|nr:hypothetical protein [Shewanella sp. P1-14-1]KPZ70233.1 hypothetical protein AN944_02305 [Shewanella sp. P1-14-1]